MNYKNNHTDIFVWNRITAPTLWAKKQYCNHDFHPSNYVSYHLVQRRFLHTYPTCIEDISYRDQNDSSEQTYRNKKATI